MPRIKRWFRVSHDINRDPEMWEFRDLIGNRADAIWDEILSIADRNDGELPGAFEAYRTLLAHACHSTPTRVRTALEWLTEPRGRRQKPWVSVDSDGTARVTNYAKYNNTKESIEIPGGNRKGPLLSETSYTSYIKKHKNVSLSKPKTPYPENFMPSDGLREWYGKQRNDPIESHLEAFADFHVARGSRFTDWEAAFRTWVRNAARFSRGPELQKEGELSERTKRILKRGL